MTDHKQTFTTQKPIDLGSSILIKAVEAQFTSYFLQKLGPSTASEAKRQNIFELIKGAIEKKYRKFLSQLTIIEGEQNVLVLKYGSDPLKTYLPDSDIDITVVPLVHHSTGPLDLTLMTSLQQLNV
jgi:hypothetical protein